MKERAYAKINLCLDVVGKREDGYHELKMIMVPVHFYDVLEMNPSLETTMHINRTFLPINEKNTVIQAIQIMKQRYNIQEEFTCELSKHIPTQAGLAGGSADAAAAIRILNRMYHLHMSKEEMIEVGKQVGADVPFCLLNQPAYVEGIGEQITPFQNHTNMEILLVKPHHGVSTKEAFEKLEYDHLTHPDCLGMREALMNNDYEGVIQHLENSLEEVSMNLVEEIRTIKEELLALGMDGALMSGSGSTVFGFTQDHNVLTRAQEKMKEKHYFVRSTRIYQSHSF